jgi:SAM-dependent methyltransferase
MEIEQSNNPDDGLDLDQLMAQIRKQAEERKRKSFQNGAPLIYRQLTTQGFDSLLSPRDWSFPSLKLQPALEKREAYQLGDLLGFHDEAFLRNAYQVILRREPDDAGFAQYLKNLRSGRYSKIDILRSLRFSSEGRKANVSIKGLGRLMAYRKLYRVPVVGYLLRLAVTVARLPVLITNHRQLEAHTMAQFERVANHLNDATHHFSEVSRKQAELNRRQLETIDARLNDLQGTLRVQIESLVNEQGKMSQTQNSLHQTQVDIYSRLDEINQNAKELSGIDERNAASLHELKIRLDHEVEDFSNRLQSAHMKIAQQETRLSFLLDDARKSLSETASPDQIETWENEDDHLLDSLYFSLENVLRGTPEEIKEEVKVYLPVLKRAGVTSGILDIGCGRGELLAVFREAGLQARGIDLNRIVLEQCRAQSLDVVESDALSYLAKLSDESLNAVTALHFAEHLPLKTLVRFLDEVGRVLRPGGLIILETPNPENLLVGSCNFYLDPTHHNPIPIPTMELLLEARGFRCQETMKLHPVASAKIDVKDQLTSHLNHYLYGPMNYAVVARKPGNLPPSDLSKDTP